MRAFELKIPPVAVTLLFAGLMWLAARWVAQASFQLPGSALIAVFLVGLGAIIAVAGVVAFRQKETTVDPTNPGKTTAIVDDGIYRYTRNPMYLGLAFALAGWAVYLGNGIALLLVAACIAYLTRFQIVPEERALQDKFGDAYDDYKSRVRRWL